MQTHETISSFRMVVLGSNRKFGITFGLIFFAIAIWPLLRGAQTPNWWALGAAAAFLMVAWLRAEWLAPLNRAWFKLGLALNAIVNPIVMAILFFGAVVPFGWYLRGKRGDPLDLAAKPEAPTYWTLREPAGPRPGTFDKQF